MAAYSNSFRGVFVLDDVTAIAQNPSIRTLWPLTSIMNPPKNTALAGRPVANLTFALNYALAPVDVRDVFFDEPRDPRGTQRLQRNVRGYHALNLGLHLLAALTLFGIVKRTLSAPAFDGRFRTSAEGIATAVAAIWVVHPLTTGAVTYIVQRAESLMALCYLLTLYAAIRAAGGGRRLWWTVGALAACLFGIGSKESMATVPVVVAVWDWLFLRESWRETLARRWPLYAALAGTWIPLGLILATAPRSASVGVGLHGVTPWSYLLTQGGVLLHYLRLVVVPWPLVLDYEWPVAAVTGNSLASVAAMSGLVSVTVWGIARRSPWAMAGASFFLILGPTSSVVPIVTEVAAEHRMYLPLAALIAAVATLVVTAWKRAPALCRLQPEASRTIAAVAVIVAAGSLGTATYLRNADYEDMERLLRDTIKNRPLNSRARHNLGAVLIGQGRGAEAETQLREAVRLNPNFPESQTSLGVALAIQGRPAEALPFMQRAVTLEPRFFVGWRNYAEALSSSGRFREAAEAHRRALALQPDDPRILTSLAWILATASEEHDRDGRAAVTMAKRAVDLTHRQNFMALEALAAAYAESASYADAVETGEKAVALARAAGVDDRVSFLENCLALYRTGRPCRQTLTR